MDNGLPDNADLSRLTEKDKVELQQFLNHENHRARIQANVHNLADVCFRKCISGPFKSGSLDRTEESCMANCVERFLDISTMTLQHLRNSRQS